MAIKKTTPPNHAAGRRPLDSFDSLRPSSLPPELGSLDMSWDDDPRSMGAIDLLQHSDADLDVDAGERTTAVPAIPMDQLVQSTMAEADAREREQAGLAFDPRHEIEHWHNAPTATSHERPLEPSAGLSPMNRISDPALTQPAPARRADLPHGAASPSRSGQEPSEPQSRRTDAREPAASSHRGQRPDRRLAPSDALLTSRSMAGPVGPSSSHPPAQLEHRLSAPPTLRRTDLDDLRHQMKDRYATGDFSGTLELAEGLLEADTGDLEAQRFVTSCRDILTQMLTSRIGSFQQIVEVALTPEELRWLTLDHRAGFFLSIVDGSSSIDELLDISGMARLESLKILSALIDQRVLRLVPH